MDKNTKNKISNLDNLSLEIYNDKNFVKSYSDRIEYNSHNFMYERPATMSLIKISNGMKVLDAGCGPGVYSEWLAGKGAEVTSIDYSDEMIRLTKEKAVNARIIKANLNNPLDFLNDGEFDLVLSSMVIHYIKDWQSLFSEFNRVLKVNGELVFSTHHPFMDFSFHSGGNYYNTELIEDEWPAYDIRMKFFRRPLSEIFRVLKETDFYLDEVLEPLPTEECREKYPDTFEILSTKPWFIFFKVIKIK